MTQEERRIWLLRYLLEESAQYGDISIPETAEEQKELLRSLMNVRPPKPVSGEFLNMQDEYLQVENAKDGFADIEELMPVKSDSRLYLWQGDITRLAVDAIVNAANSQLLGCFRPLHGCIDNIIHSKAGVQLRLKCNEIMQAQGHEEPTGQAKITPAYNLPCKYVIHTVGPIVQGRLTKEHEGLLASCYRSCLELAEKNGVFSVAFCCISTGVFMFPNQRAAEIAVETVRNWLNETGSKIKVVFNVFKDIDLEIYDKLLNEQSVRPRAYNPGKNGGQSAMEHLSLTGVGYEAPGSKPFRWCGLVKKLANRATLRVALSCMIWFTLNAIFLLPVLPAAASETAKEDTGEAAEKAVSWREYNGKRIGVLTGPLMEDAAAEYFPDSEYLIFNSYPDCMTALLAGKIDGYLGDEPSMKTIHAEQPEIDYIHERITENNYSFAFRKDDPESAALCEELNAFLAKCRADGTMQELDDIWFGVEEERKVVDMSDLVGESGTIKVVTTSTDMPFSYIKDGKNVGYDIDLVVRFCRERGYALELGDVDFAGRIPAIESGRYDFTTDMNVTPEREEQVLFSDPTSKGGIVLAVLSKDLEARVTETKGNGEYKSLADFGGKSVGVVTGAIQGPAIEKEIPTAEVKYYNSVPDLLVALRQGKIDAFSATDQIIRYLMIENDDLTYLDEPLTETMNTGVIFSKTEAGATLREEFNTWLAEAVAAGKLDDIEKSWLGKDESQRTVLDISGLTGENGTLTLATDASMAPGSYIKDNTNVGMDIDVVLRFCEARGYALRIEDMSFSGIVDAVVAGKCDFAAGAIAYTKERAESVDFSNPVFKAYSVLAYLRTDEEPGADEEQGAGNATMATAWDGVRDSFNKTFLRENRYQLFLSGIGTTMLITLLSIFFGTALGFIVFMLCRNGNRIANGMTKVSVWLVQGTPMVVLLMILYYIIFASVAISGVAVAVLGFTLTFGAAVFGLLRLGVGTIDRGQYEAAYALGHSNRHTFFRIILPQAIPHVLPAYQGEIVGLLKATAIVGYIAVQDLPKMGDIVRSRTYEAFFPLIAVTVIYFALEALLGFAVSRIRISIDPKKRSRNRILKGVRHND